MPKIYIDTNEQRELARLMRTTADALAGFEHQLGRQTAELSPPPADLLILRFRSAAARTRVRHLGEDLRRRSALLDREVWWTELSERVDGMRWAARDLVVAPVALWPPWLWWTSPVGALVLTWWLRRMLTPGGPAPSLDGERRSSWPMSGPSRASAPTPNVKQGPFDFPNSNIVDAARAEFLEHQRTGKRLASGGYNLPGECAVSVRRWVETASRGAATPGGVDEVSAYHTATPIGTDLKLALPGDVIQYTPPTPSGWDAAGLHTVVIAGPGDAPGTFHVYESNVERILVNGHRETWVSENRTWTPKLPTGWTVQIYRYGRVN